MQRGAAEGARSKDPTQAMLTGGHLKPSNFILWRVFGVDNPLCQPDSSFPTSQVPFLSFCLPSAPSGASTRLKGACVRACMRVSVCVFYKSPVNALLPEMSSASCESSHYIDLKPASQTVPLTSAKLLFYLPKADQSRLESSVCPSVTECPWAVLTVLYLSLPNCEIRIVILS